MNKCIITLIIVYYWIDLKSPAAEISVVDTNDQSPSELLLNKHSTPYVHYVRTSCSWEVEEMVLAVTDIADHIAFNVICSLFVELLL